MVFGCVSQFGQLGHALWCPVAPRAGAAPRGLQPHSLAHLPPSRLFHLVCGCVFIALILLDHLPQDPTAAWGACSAVSLVVSLGPRTQREACAMGAAPVTQGASLLSGWLLGGPSSSLTAEGLTLSLLYKGTSPHQLNFS